MNPLFRRLFLFCWLLAAAPVIQAGDEIVFGVFPYVTADQLIQAHTPLQRYITETLRRPVVLVSAPDFVTFNRRTQNGDYDLVLTAPHFGRLAETRDGFRRVVRTRSGVQAVFLLPRSSPIQHLRDLNGKSIMIAQPVSMLYQLAVQALGRNGLTPGQNVTILDARTHNNAILAPLHGEVDAGVTGLLIWEKLAGE
jgi:phosphonate transport system substrate-binding protein